MRLFLPLLMLSACAEEAPALLDGDWDLAAEELPLDEAGPPPVAVTVEGAYGTVSAGVFFVGEVTRVEAPVVRGRLDFARARCAWRFRMGGVYPMPVAPPGALWAFTVNYEPVFDELFQRTLVPSVCSASVFPAGAGMRFTDVFALDAATNTVLQQTPAGWVPYAANQQPFGPAGAADYFEWQHVLRTWP